MYRFFFPFALLLFTIGCSDPVSENDAEFNFDEGQAVAFESLMSSFVTLTQSGVGNDSFRERENQLITNEQAFESFWNELHGNVLPIPALPEVDFESEMVIAVILGLRSNGGYAVNIERIVQQNGTTGIEVKEEIPAAECGTAQVISSPYHIIKLQRLSGDLVFVDEQEEIGC